MTRPVVFLGPSLPLARARAILDAEYLPPAGIGDVYRALRARPPAIGIVDGYFDHTPAVRHKEILVALARGVPVYGGASMGALRAAECHAFGMVGVGAVFEMFRDGALEDDDEVAVAHAEATADVAYAPLSEAMVNIRHALARAAAAGALDAATAERLAALAKARFYPERSWAALFADARAAGVPAAPLARLREFLGASPPNLKRDDAAAVLERIARDLALPGGAPAPPAFRLEPSTWLTTILDDAVLGSTSLDVDAAVRFRTAAASLGRHVRVAHPAAAEVELEALGLFALAREGTLHGLYPSWFDALEDLSLPSDDDDEAREALEARVDALQTRLAALSWPWLDLLLPSVLARRGELADARASLLRAWGAAHARGLQRPRPADVGLDEEALLAWYAERDVGLFTRHAAHERGLDEDRAMTEIAAFYLGESSAEGAPTPARDGADAPASPPSEDEPR